MNLDLDLYHITWLDNTEDYWWLPVDHEFVKYDIASVEKVNDPVIVALYEHDKTPKPRYVT